MIALLWAANVALAQEPIVHQRLAAVLEPSGAEHMIALGTREPIGEPGDPVLAGSVEVGIIDYTSPIDTRNGAYLELVPIAFLVLRAEVVAIAMWSTGMDGAGFFPVEDDRADVRAQNLPGSEGGRASGWNARVSATLRAAIAIGPFRPIFWSQLALEHEALGDAPYHYSPRADLVLRREDWMLSSSTLALLELTLAPGIALRAGAFDDLRWIPRSDAFANQIGPALALAFDRPDPRVEEILFLVRAGTYTDDATRNGAWSALAALIVRYAP